MTHSAGKKWFPGEQTLQTPHGGRGGQDFGQHNRAGKLKTWETGNLTSRPATRPTRISDFQDFRFSPAPAAPEILPNVLGWDGDGDGDCFEHA